ncbi:MAG: hypothetical protein KTR25_05235 [Myxococcales bacterium]|nr:hypothetical protein [Myxococcales bacterium]
MPLLALKFSVKSHSPRLAQNLLWVALVRLILVTVGLVLAMLQSRRQLALGNEAWRYLAIGLIYGYSVIGIALLRKTSRYLELYSLVHIVLDTCVVTGVVFITGGADSVLAFMYVLVVLEGSLVMLTAGAVAAVASGTLLFGLVILLQLDQGLTVLPVVVPHEALFLFFIHTIGVVLVGYLASRLATKLHLADQRLAEQEEDLARLSEMQTAILRALPAGLITVSPDGYIAFGNESAHTILHEQSGSLVGRPLAAVLGPVSEVIQLTHMSQRPQSTRIRHETPMVLHDETEIQLGFSLAPLLEPEAWTARVPLSRTSSILYPASCPLNSDVFVSAAVGTVVVFQDVTEIVRLQEAVAQAERLALVGKFAAGLAHEVRNPLASMCASIEVLKHKLRPPEELQRLMRNIVHESGRLNYLVQDFLSLARPPQLQLERVDIGVLVQDVLSMFGYDQLMRTIRLKLCCSTQVEAMVDAHLIRQVVWNLLRNAAEAMSEVDDAVLSIAVGQDRTGVKVEIADNGVGMSEAQRRQAFEPFYTTKKEGSGLGLAITQSIMQAHGGEFILCSAPGVGTVVTLFLPESLPDVPARDSEPQPLMVGEVR